jgi:putative ABC transport system ATP-binding protein
VTRTTGEASTGETTPALVARALSKRYEDGTRRREVVSAVTLTVAPGTLSVLRGPSGSGKTTLLGGMIAPTSGEVFVCGEPLSRLRDHHRARARRRLVGFVFQELALLPGTTLRENVLLPLVPEGGPTPAQRGHVDALLARFELTALADTRVERLSGGERQRGALARALVCAPPVLLLDEPTAHLDAARVRDVIALLAALRDEGRTIVATTHDPRLADDSRVDRVLTLLDGRLVGEGDATE